MNHTVDIIHNGAGILLILHVSFCNSRPLSLSIFSLCLANNTCSLELIINFRPNVHQHSNQPDWIVIALFLTLLLILLGYNHFTDIDVHCFDELLTSKQACDFLGVLIILLLMVKIPHNQESNITGNLLSHLLWLALFEFLLIEGRHNLVGFYLRAEVIIFRHTE